MAEHLLGPLLHVALEGVFQPDPHHPIPQTKQSLELEVLRLSMADLHASRLELSQTTQQREREAALSQVQAELQDKWAGENAILQAKQQMELDRLRQQHQRDLGEPQPQQGAPR